VCIGPSPSSAKCIRTASRMAEAYHAPWVAVNVLLGETGDGVKKNTSLAERLGAKIVTLHGTDVVLSVSEYAKMTGITSIVLGKRKRADVIRNPFSPEFSDRLSALLPEVEVHIIPDNPVRERLIRHTDKSQKGRTQNNISFSGVMMSFALIALATFVSFLLKGTGLGAHNIIMVYILSVVLISRFTEGYLYGLLSSVAAVLCFNFFFTEPYFTFTTNDPAYPVTFLIMFLVSAITSAITGKVKEQIRSAVFREQRTEMLYDFNRKLLSTNGDDNIRQATTDYLMEVFSRTSALYTTDPLATGRPISSRTEGLCDNESAIIHWVFANGKPAGAGTGTLAMSPAYYLPVLSQNQVLGVIGVSCADQAPLSRDNLTFLGMTASLVALALERQVLSDSQRTLILDTAKEKMRNDFLRGISQRKLRSSRKRRKP